MKTATLALTALASASAAYAESIYLSAKGSDGAELCALSSVHAGAGINYVFISSSGTDGETYTLDGSAITGEQGGYPARLGFEEPILAYGAAVSGAEFTFDGDAVSNYQFFGCNNIPYDSYQISASSKVIAANAAGNDTLPYPECVPVTLYKNTAASSSSASSSAASATQGWNTTATDQITVTDYTTYCPESTTVTITTCTQNKCAPHKITVTEPTTITVTGECVVPSTAAPATTAPATAAPATTAPATTAPTTVATSSTGKSTVAAVSTAFNGAARQAVGAAGVVGLAAFFL